jgi:hypothetical protein
VRIRFFCAASELALVLTENSMVGRPFEQGAC